jgi:hypothetical protein
MTDTTDLGTVWVVGQRRRPDGNFPPASGGGGGIPGDDGGIHQEEVDPDPQDPPYSPPHPCDNPETALPWNADAAGAQSADAFVSKAAGVGDTNPQTGMPTLANREFGRGLARGPNNSVWGNAVTPGLDQNPDGSTGDLTINFDPITLDIYIGDVHSHPNGNPYPSQTDWDFFLLNNRLARENYGRTSETFYLYIVTVGADGQPDNIYVYEDGPRAANSPEPPRPTELGPEVNPDAQPCS